MPRPHVALVSTLVCFQVMQYSGAIKGSFVVENFPNLVTEVEEIFEACASEASGKVTTYIPGLSVNPGNKWAASICTIDGEICTENFLLSAGTGV